MKIFYLAPGHADPERLAAYSFLNEEILGLAGRGHTVFTVSDRPAKDGDWPDTVRPLSVLHGGLSARLRALALTVRHGAPWRGTWRGDTRARLYGARIEAFTARAARREGADVLHSHFGWPTGWGGALAAAAAGKPLVASLRGMDLMADARIGYGQRLDPGYEAAVRLLLRRADVTTYASDFMREVGIQEGADPDYAVTIPKGVDLRHFAPESDRTALKEELGVEGAMILTVAGLHRLKGIDDILRALSTLPASLDYTFVACGEGAEREALEGLARELGIADRVRLMGRVPRSDIPRYFAACDVFVLASLMEAAGNVLLEAMAAGRPVVCTDSGGPPEYVRHGRTGFVVPTRDPGALADRLERLLADPEEADAMGAAGRATAEAEHGYDRMIRGFEAAYEEAVRRHRLRHRRS